MTEVSSKRSEQIRLKRKEMPRKSKPAAGRRKKALSTPVSPPVMARNPASAVGKVESKSTKKTRRRYDVTLGNQGAEVRLPAIPQVRIGWRFVSFLILALFSYGLFSIWNSSDYRVEAAQVNGLKHVTSLAVNTVLDVAGKPVFTMDAKYMEQLLQDEFHEFSEATVLVSLPDSVVVSVTERIPVLIWQQDGRTNLVDENGVIFPLREDSVSFPLPVIEAEANPPMPAFINPEKGQDLPSQLVSLESVPVNEDIDGTKARPLLTQEMVKAVLLMAENAPDESILTYTVEHGLVWKDKRGWSVYFGAPEDMEMKLRVYRAILDHLKSQDTQPEMISVEFLNGTYYRLSG